MKLREALGECYEVEFKYYNHIEGRDQLGEALKSGDVHIAGELSPIEFNKFYKGYKFNALLGIEYNRSAFYRSLLFVPQGEFRGRTFNAKGETECYGDKELGRDYIKDIKQLINEHGKEIVHLEDENSTSGYYYPKSFMIDNRIEISNVETVSENELVFKKVLKKPEGDNQHKYIAGFLADFRYEYYFCKKGLWTDEEYYKPLVIDKSDPIPNGVFVISKVKNNDNELDVDKIIRLWKGIQDVKLPTGSTITGWYTGLDKYLKVVEEIQNKVDADKYFTKYSKPIYALLIIVIVIIVSTISFFVLKTG